MGLNLKAKPNEQGEIDPDDFVPMVLACGNHHLLKELMKDETTEGLGEDSPRYTIPDEDYEVMSQRLMADMEPIPDDPLAGKSQQELLAEIDTRGLGIKTLDDTKPSDTVEVIDG